MSTNAITGNVIAEIESSSTKPVKFVSDLNKMDKDLQTGNLTAAEADYVTLIQDALNGLPYSAAASAPTTTVNNEPMDVVSSSNVVDISINDSAQNGIDWQSSNSASQQDLFTLDSKALNTMPTASKSSTNFSEIA